jgi:hypothetical protein
VGTKRVTGAKVGHLSRSRFPYPVSWPDIEFNQVAMMRVFDEPTAQAIEKALQPHPTQVQDWLAQAHFREWR